MEHFETISGISPKSYKIVWKFPKIPESFQNFIKKVSNIFETESFLIKIKLNQEISINTRVAKGWKIFEKISEKFRNHLKVSIISKVSEILHLFLPFLPSLLRLNSIQTGSELGERGVQNWKKSASQDSNSGHPKHNNATHEAIGTNLFATLINIELYKWSWILSTHIQYY